MKRDKAPGEDNITRGILQDGGETIVTILTNLFNVRDMLDLQVPTCILRSGRNGPLLTVARAKKFFEDRIVSREAPRLWNSLPRHIRLAVTKQQFKKKAKTRLFLQYFGD